MISRWKQNLRLIRKELAYQVHRPRRVLFDHIPKCAGSTITEYLFGHYPQRCVFQTNGRQPHQSVQEFQALPEAERYRYQLIVGHNTHELLDAVHPDTITLTVLRDPIDRIVSHYFFVRQDEHHYLHQQVMKFKIQLQDYVALGLSDELHNWYTMHFSGLSRSAIQAEPDRAVQLAAQVIRSRYDVIGFRENLSTVIKTLRQKVGLFHPFDGCISNKTHHRPTLAEIPQQTKMRIFSENKLDVQLYNWLKSSLPTQKTELEPQQNLGSTGDLERFWLLGETYSNLNSQ